ncbi:myosin phosphatase Rho-interacting protein-like [Puntigrus tetrazona]|uniref:myosin phosphatase Rho-interacting protein-like n=1 Tax=Puntigrus tetrazona TaxID=1606681 RepID=UPI001C89B126|nr:myosin phosphatase Rho-interacting protein-like [Puntigrus tetrazona]
MLTHSPFTPKTMFSARENRCHRFQANIFNKSKCQNCFKPVDSHILSEADLIQTKPVQVGWLLLAPEDADFSSCVPRKRKWQRRYFVLYEHGLLRYSLDKMPSTLPQGSVNMSQCCEVLDASSQTGFQNCLRLCFTDRDYYIRTESTDGFSISRWQENLIVYPKAAKSNQKKKGRIQPTHPHTDNRKPNLQQQQQRTSGATKGRSVTNSIKGATKNDRRGSVVNPVEEVLMLSSGKKLEEEPLGVLSSSSLSQSSGCSDTDGTKNRLGTESGYSSLEKTSSSPRVVDAETHTDTSRPQEAVQQEGSFLDAKVSPSTPPTSSTEQKDHKTTVTSQASFTNDIPDHSQHLISCSLRSKSLERRPLDSTATPDLLNFKKGWMSRLGEDGKWRKHWFVLTDQTLRFYRDSAAEEAADVDGEINLSTCYDVTDFPVQRNYGFQIHTKDGVFTLCAMTYGIRRNWVQAVMKNIRPAVAPDVTCSIPQKVPMTSTHARTSSCQCKTVSQESEQRTHPQWNHNGERSLPPAPASSPEEQISHSAPEAMNEYLQKKRVSQRQSLNIMSADIPSNLSLIAMPSRTSPESISPDSLEVDAGTIYVPYDGHGELLEAKPKQENQVDRSTSPLPVSFSSTSAQTEWQWDVELQSLRRELKAEHERNQTEEKELRLSEARLQAELSDSKECLQRTELKIQDAETLLKEREEVLESLRGQLEEVTGRLKATEEAQALKEVRLQRHLRLLQESQEREGGASVTASTNQNSELQNQLEESDSEVCRLQARLQTEETLYYDMEHDYERACEELQTLRGALLDCERALESKLCDTEERLRELTMHLQQQQQQQLNTGPHGLSDSWCSRSSSIIRREQKGSELFYVLPWPESSSSGTKMENSSKQGDRLADISPPELAPYSEQMDDEMATDLLLEGSEVQLACRKSLVAELRAQAHSLQNLSTQLQSTVRETDLPAVCRSMETLFQEQTERYEEKLREERVVVEKAEQERVSAETNAQLRTEEAKKLQLEFEEKLQELQKIHEEEMSRLHEYYIETLSRPNAATLSELEENEEKVTALQDRIRELETEVTCLKTDLSNQDVKAFKLDLETIKATYEHGFSIMEDSHQRVIEEMQRQHQKEVERLTEERERVLQEETNATIAAIEAMRKAHKEEMDKTQKALQNGANVDIRQLHAQYNEELETLHRELEVLSEQYSQKCLENTNLNRTIETERESLSTTQRENQELHIHNQVHAQAHRKLCTFTQPLLILHMYHLFF